MPQEGIADIDSEESKPSSDEILYLATKDQKYQVEKRKKQSQKTALFLS